MSAKSAYHHGDLRRALIDAALEVTRQDGVAAMTLRRVARAAGVSHAAPYHHFEDRRALVAAVAEVGFANLAENAETARCSVDDPTDQLIEAGVAYVVFAVEHPEHFRLMFSAEIADTSPYPELQEAAGRAKAVMERAVAAVDEPADRSDAKTEGALAIVHAWALAHGLATLLIDGQLGSEPMTPGGAARLAREALRRSRSVSPT